MAKIGNLKDKDGNILYPITRTNLVLDENGKNVDDKYQLKGDYALSKDIISIKIYDSVLTSSTSSITVNNLNISNNEILDIYFSAPTLPASDLVVRVNGLTSGHYCYGWASGMNNPVFDSGSNESYFKLGYSPNSYFTSTMHFTCDKSRVKYDCISGGNTTNNAAIRLFTGFVNASILSSLMFYLTSGNIPSGTHLAIYKRVR